MSTSRWAALLIWAFAAAAPAQTPPADIDAGALGSPVGPEAFLEANAAYEASDYGRAVRLYGQLIAAGYESGHLRYNLGNAYLRNGELGRSIASYRRSWLLLPRDEDVRANLDFARQTTQDALRAPGPSAVTRTLFFWHYGLSVAELKWTALGLNLVFWLLVALRLLKRNSEVLRWLTVLVLVPLLAVVASLGLRLFDPAKVAVVIPQEVNAHSGPSDSEVVRFKLHAGSEVIVRDRRDGWLRISLPDDQQGWIEAEFADVVDG